MTHSKKNVEKVLEQVHKLEKLTNLAEKELAGNTNPTTSYRDKFLKKAKKFFV